MRPLREHLEREVSEGTVDAHWAAAAERLEAARRPAPRWRAPALAAAAALLVVAGVAWLTLRKAHPELVPGQALLADGATVAQLPDGSKVELSFGAGVQLASSAPELIEIELSRGTATFDVVKRPTRRFVVQVDDVSVVVVGTRFTVKRDGADSVEVAVERGQVDVRSQGLVKRLGAGEQWRGHSVDTPAPGSAAPEQIIEGPGDPRAGEVVEVELPDDGDGPGANEAKPPRPHRRHKVRVPKRSAAAPAGGGALGSPAPAEASEADLLFGRTLAARSTRRWSLAADYADQFLSAYPDDSRAGLMAFELGRILADHLGRPGAATAAYAKARKLDPQGDFIEELLVRQAQAAWAANDASQCERLRDEYLSRFRGGQFTSTIKGSCGPKEP